MKTNAGRVLLIAVVGMLVIAAVAAVLANRRSSTQWEEGSPEATVGEYFEAVLAGDAAAAVEHLDPDGSCTADDLEGGAYSDRVSRIVLRSVSVSGDTAQVRIDRVQGQAGPLGSSEWSRDETFELRRATDGWVITGSPWPIYRCTGNTDGGDGR